MPPPKKRLCKQHERPDLAAAVVVWVSQQGLCALFQSSTTEKAALSQASPTDPTQQLAEGPT